MDSASGEAILSPMRRFAAEAGKAVVMASHDPKARRFADRVFAMTDGRLEPIDG